MHLSWQLRFLNWQLRHLIKPQLRKTADPNAAQEALAFVAGMVFRQPPFLRHYVRAGGLHWFASGRCKPGKVILFFHGGGYVAGSPEIYSGMLGRLSRLSGIEVCAPRYRLAQAAPAPAAFDDCLVAWDALQAQGFTPQDIVIGGDSAGGGLAMADLSALCQRGTPPTACFAFSPCVDFALPGDSLSRNRDTDVILPVERFEQLAQIVPAGFDSQDPRISPLYADFPDCPPILIQYSETEILRDDALRMAKRVSQFGAQPQLQAHPNAPHVWQLLDGWIPEARASLRQAANFAQDSLAETKR